MNIILIILLSIYSMYVGYFIGVNRESWKHSSSFLSKSLSILFCFCTLWFIVLLDIVIELMEIKMIKNVNKKTFPENYNPETGEYTIKATSK